MIFNIEAFVKILPKFFKTKNYSSFVRQLNLYNFHKIKNADGFIEFGHEQFRRNNVENLQFITRKVNQDAESNKLKVKGQKPMSFEYNRLLGIIRNLENSLKAANKDTNSAAKENKALLKQIEQIKISNEKRTRKLLFVVWLSSSNFETELLLKIRALYRKFGVETEESLFETPDLANLSMILEEKRLFAIENSDILIDQLLLLVTDFHNSRPRNKSNKVCIDNVLFNFDGFGKERFPNRSPPKMNKGSSCARSDLYSLENSPLRRFPSVVNFSLDYENPFNEFLENDFEEKDLSNVSLMKSGHTTHEADSVLLRGMSFSELPSPKSERIYNY